MKHTNIFDYFLKEIVNLNKTRVEVAEASVVTLTTFLQNNEVFKEIFQSATPQGSYRQGTIIKPVNPDQDFDVDLLIELSPVDKWGAADYLKTLAAEFQKTSRYKDKVDTRGKTRCVTIDYESDFHVDIVPSITTASGQVIMNKKTNEYETTDGDGYATWFENQNTIAGNNALVKVVRLIKYVRDYHQSFEAKSVLLTTLLGNQVTPSDSTNVHYADLPTALKTIINRLDLYLQQNERMPEISNPVLPAESFARNWDQDDYDKFRKQIHEYNETINRAYAESDEEKSLKEWQTVFGEDFSLPETESEKSVGITVTDLPLGSITHQQPLSRICKGESLTHKVRIDGYLYSADGRKKFRGINSGAKLPSGLAIKYQAQTNFREPYDLWWQVVNTGRHAATEGGLRGDFFKAKLLKGKLSSNQLINWEVSQYTGKHWIECFVVNKDGLCVARSKPFFVIIKNPAF